MLKQIKGKVVSDIDSFSSVTPTGAPYGLQIKFEDGGWLTVQVFDGKLLIAVDGKRIDGPATGWMPQTYLL